MSRPAMSREPLPISAHFDEVNRSFAVHGDRRGHRRAHPGLGATREANGARPLASLVRR